MLCPKLKLLIGCLLKRLATLKQELKKSSEDNSSLVNKIQASAENENKYRWDISISMLITTNHLYIYIFSLLKYVGECLGEGPYRCLRKNISIETAQQLQTTTKDTKKASSLNNFFKIHRNFIFWRKLILYISKLKLHSSGLLLIFSPFCLLAESSIWQLCGSCQSWSLLCKSRKMMSISPGKML